MRKLIPVVAFTLVAVSGKISSAQSPVSIKPSIYGGVAIPTGDLGDNASTGYTLGAALDAHVIAMPLSWRAEGSYTSFDAKGGADAKSSDASGRINAVLGMPSIGIAPYVIGGVGIYHVKAEESGGGITVSSSDNKFGWNIGAGVDLPVGTLGGRVEIRYHSISTDNGNYTYVPITFGIRF